MNQDLILQGLFHFFAPMFFMLAFFAYIFGGLYLLIRLTKAFVDWFTHDEHQDKNKRAKRKKQRK